MFHHHHVTAGRTSALLTALLLVSCKPGPTESPPSAPAGSRLVVVSGDAQEGVACSLLESSLVVRLESASGESLAGYSVNWGVTQSSGDLPTQEMRTNGDGQASATWLLGRGQTQHVIVSSGQAESATFTAVASPNPTAAKTCS